MSRNVLILMAIAGFAWLPVSANVCSGTDAAEPVRTWIDASLDRRWEAVADCRHPERPWQIVSLGKVEQGRSTDIAPTGPGAAVWALAAPKLGASTTSTVAMPKRAPFQATISRPALVVHSGASVRLWKQSADTRIELAAVAITDAPLGGRLRVRLAGSYKQLEGIVRGPGSVELAQGPVAAWGQP